MSIASISSCLGDGVGVRLASFSVARPRTGLEVLDCVGVLLSVAAAELNLERSTFEFVLSIRSLSTSKKVTAMLAGAGALDIEEVAVVV